MNYCFSRICNPSRSLRLAIVALMVMSATPALGQLMLYPTRLVVEGNERTAQVELMNNGTTSATYRISLVNRRMNETGAFSDIEKPLPGEQFADHMLRYSPRQVTLAPGEGQTVRLMVRKPAGLQDGEYRSHLLFSQQPDVEGRNSVENLDGPSDEIGVQITALVGASIPVIVRHGDTSAEVRLSGLQLLQNDGKPSLAFVIERRGSQSVYGDLTVTHAPAGGQAKVLARANGVAVYTPNPLRRASIVLPMDAYALKSGDRLLLTYRQQAEDGGELLAQETLILP